MPSKRWYSAVGAASATSRHSAGGVCRSSAKATTWSGTVHSGSRSRQSNSMHASHWSISDDSAAAERSASVMRRLIVAHFSTSPMTEAG